MYNYSSCKRKDDIFKMVAKKKTTFTPIFWTDITFLPGEKHFIVNLPLIEHRRVGSNRPKELKIKKI